MKMRLTQLSRLLGSTQWHRRGATPVEYIVALILVVLVVLSALRLFGGAVEGKFESGEAKIRLMNESKEKQAAEADHLDDTTKGEAGSSTDSTFGEETPEGEQVKVHASNKGAFRSGELEGTSEESEGEAKSRRAAGGTGGAVGSVDEAESAGGGGGEGREKRLKKGKGRKGVYGGSATEEGTKPVGFNGLTLVLFAMVFVGLLIVVIKSKRREGGGGGKGDKGGEGDAQPSAQDLRNLM